MEIFFGRRSSVHGLLCFYGRKESLLPNLQHWCHLFPIPTERLDLYNLNRITLFLYFEGYWSEKIFQTFLFCFLYPCNNSRGRMGNVFKICYIKSTFWHHLFLDRFDRIVFNSFSSPQNPPFIQTYRMKILKYILIMH